MLRSKLDGAEPVLCFQFQRASRNCATSSNAVWMCGRMGVGFYSSRQTTYAANATRVRQAAALPASSKFGVRPNQPWRSR